MAKDSLNCPYCGKKGFKAAGPLNSHIKAIHPTQQQADENNYQITYTLPKMEPGPQLIQCPACRRPHQVLVKNDGTIASSDELPKPPSSNETGRRSNVKRGTHPVILKERYKMRWNEDKKRWKRTVAMSGTHGRTAPEMPWHELGIDEFWCLNDMHGIGYVKPHIKEGLVSRWWQLHHRWRFTRRATRHATDHWQWLQDVKDVPRIIMQRKYREIPNSEKFPMREVCDIFIGDKLGRGAGYVHYYFTNTFSYMFAQILYEKVKGIHDWERVELYGCELEQLETEYFRQRPGIEFWFGLLLAHDIELYVPESCFMAYAQDIKVDNFGNQSMVGYPGYMAYGYKSPSLEEAKETKQPLGVDPTEETVLRSWDDLLYRNHIYAFNEEYAKMLQRHDLSETEEEIKVLNEWLDEIEQFKQ